MEPQKSDDPLPQNEMTSRDYSEDVEAHYSYQEAALKDQIRTAAYRDVIMQNQHQFKNKIVLEFPCGLCLLSMFAARAGAERVIAIDESRIIEIARRLVQLNNLEDRITLIQGKVETVELPDGIKQVDIMLSDWMRESLYSRAYLSDVIYARNKWLKPTVGLIYPDRCTLYLTAIEARAQKEEEIDWWNDVYGFNMNVIGKQAREEPLVDEVEARQIVTDSFLLKEINMYTVARQDINFTTTFSLRATRKDCISALVTFFIAEFSRCKQRVTLSTSPDTPLTHWKQTVFFLDNVLHIESGEEIKGTFAMLLHGRRRRRELEIDIDLRFQGVQEPEVMEHNHYVMRQ